MSDKHLVASNKMSATADIVLNEARDCIATAAGARGWNDTRQSWLRRAARRLEIPYSRVFGIWYGRARLYADEFETLKQRRAEYIARSNNQEEAYAELRERAAAHEFCDGIDVRVARDDAGAPGLRGVESSDGQRDRARVAAAFAG